jgi:hypothetical protein
MTNEEKVWVLTNMRYYAETGVLERWVTHNGIRELKSPYWKECSDKPISRGYAQVSVLGAMRKYHRICWLLAHGSIDDGLSIDHIDGNRTDNRLCNLRLGTSRENQQNLRCHRNGNLVGATWSKRNEKWQAKIQINGKDKHLGYFQTELEAHEAYNQSIKELYS